MVEPEAPQEWAECDQEDSRFLQTPHSLGPFENIQLQFC